MLDGQLRPVPQGAPGELVVGGPFVARGYLAGSSQSSSPPSSFIPQSLLLLPNDSNSGGSDGKERLVYRTGDLVRVRADGLVELLGRIAGDRQVKLRGVRLHLADVEAALWAGLRRLYTVPAPVSQIVVVLHRSQMLVAYFTAAADNTAGREESGGAASAVCEALKRAAAESLPAAMVPARYLCLEAVPTTAAGKTDYGLLSSGLTTTISETNNYNNRNRGRNHSNESNRTKLTDVQRVIAQAWRSAVGGPPSSFSSPAPTFSPSLCSSSSPFSSRCPSSPPSSCSSPPPPSTCTDDDDELKDGRLTPSSGFFDVGGHSLALVHVQASIRRLLGVKISLADMFANPTLEGMEALVADNKDKNPDAHCTSKASADAMVDWAAEATLPSDFPRHHRRHRRHPGPSESGGGILLVGAAGMLGTHLLAHLLETTTVPQIYCIAIPDSSTEIPGLSSSSSSSTAAKRRIIECLQTWGLRLQPTDSRRIAAYAGSLSHPTLGLTAPDLALLAAAVETIYVADGGAVSLLKNYHDLRAATVGATLFLARFAAGCVAPATINYVSTWGVPHLQSLRDSQPLLARGAWATGPSPIDHIQPGPSPRMGYLKARWACERLLHQAAEQAGIRANIVRGAGLLCGSTRTGIPLERSDINRRIVAASLLVGAVPDFGSARGGGMAWLPVDYFVSALVSLCSPPGADAGGGGDVGGCRVWHMPVHRHTLYRDMARTLQPLLLEKEGAPGMAVLQPTEWLARVSRTLGDGDSSADVDVFCETLQVMSDNGWAPFALGPGPTAATGEGAQPPAVDADMIARLVVGLPGF